MSRIKSSGIALHKRNSSGPSNLSVSKGNSNFHRFTIDVHHLPDINEDIDDRESINENNENNGNK